MRFIYTIIAATIAVIHASPLYDFDYDHVELPDDLPAGTKVMNAASIAATDFGDEEPIVFAPAPTHTLSPSIHHDHDTSDINHLMPHHSKSLYFAHGHPHTKPYLDVPFLHAETTFKYPAVVLEHSCHIAAAISGTRLTVVFTNITAFERVSSTWQDASAGNPFILITTTGSKDGHYVYYLVTQVHCDESRLSCILEVILTDFDDLREGFQLSFGHVDHPLAKRVPDETNPPLQARQAGSSFDERLDAALGYHPWNSQTFKSELQDFAGGLQDYDPSHYNDLNQDADGLYASDGSVKVTDASTQSYDPGDPVQVTKRTDNDRRSLLRRASGSAMAAAIREQGAVASGNLYTDVVDGIVSAFGSGFKALGRAIAGAFTSNEPAKPAPPGFNIQRSFHKPDPKDITVANRYRDLPFWKDETGRSRTARELYAVKRGNADFNIYCVDCGITAEISISGTVNFNIFKGLTAGNVRLQGKFGAGLGLGMVAGYTQTQSNTVRVFAAGIPGFAVPGFLNIGPTLTIDALYGFNIDVQGTFLVGGIFSIEGLDAVVDIINPANNMKPNIQPKLNPYFGANGKVNANINVGIDAAIALGISIANDRIYAGVSVQSEPRFLATLSANAQIGAGGPTCAGIGLGLNLQHSLYATARLRAPLIGDKSTDKFKFTNDLDFNVGSGCFTAQKSKRQSDNPNMAQIGNAALYSDLKEPNYTLTAPDANSVPNPFAQFDSQPYKWPSSVEALFNGKAPSTASPPNTPDSDTKGTSFNYTIVMDAVGQYVLTHTKTGNIELQSAGTTTDGNNLFEVYRNVLVGDTLGRTLVYYEKEMQAYNVSRLRLVTSDKMPLTSHLVTLIPVSDGNQLPTNYGIAVPEAFLVAFDTLGNYFWLTVCNYADGKTPSKLFLVADRVNGLQKLADPSLVNVLTGGAISSCQLIGLVDGAKGY